MDRDVTSGEKLLRLIRKKDRTQNDTIGISESNSKGFIDKNKDNNGISNIDIFKKINRILILICLLLICLIALIWFIPIDNNFAINSNITDIASREKELKPSLIKEKKRFNYYKDILDKKDIFLLPWENKTNVGLGRNNAIDLRNKLKVVGIILDNKPKAAIENIKTKQTFFLSVGEKISGATVTNISEEKVVFLYNGEKITLIP